MLILFDCYRYMVLAVATIEEDRSNQDVPSTKKGSGKCVMVYINFHFFCTKMIQ